MELLARMGYTYGILGLLLSFTQGARFGGDHIQMVGYTYFEDRGDQSRQSEARRAHGTCAFLAEQLLHH